MAQADAKFLHGSLLKHIVVMSSAASLGLMAIFIVDLVDMLFISMLGNEALAAAVGYAGAILFFTTSMSIGLAITAGALVSRALGQGDADRAREILTHVLILGVLFALVIVALVWVSLPALTGLVGATGETLSAIVVFISPYPENLPRCRGRARICCIRARDPVPTCGQVTSSSTYPLTRMSRPDRLPAGSPRHSCRHQSPPCTAPCHR